MLSSGVFADSNLSGSEIKAEIEGKAFPGVSSNQRYFTKTFNSDGTYKIEFESGSVREGTWEVKEGKYCQSFNDDEECFVLMLKDDKIMVFQRDGSLHSTLNTE